MRGTSEEGSNNGSNNNGMSLAAFIEKLKEPEDNPAVAIAAIEALDNEHLADSIDWRLQTLNAVCQCAGVDGETPEHLVIWLVHRELAKLRRDFELLRRQNGIV